MITKTCTTCTTCTTCKWMKGTGEYAECIAPQNMETRTRGAPSQHTADLVGVIIPKDALVQDQRWYFCTTHRGIGRIWAHIVRACGSQGRWWVAK